MEKNALKKIIFFALLIVALLTLYFRNPLVNAPKGLYGVPAVSTDYPQLSMNVLQVVEDGSHIYILYNSSTRIVQMYDLEGNYECSFFFYSFPNGEFILAAEKDTLYVEDERGNVYEFNDGQFKHFYDQNEFSEQLENIQFDRGASSASYSIRNKDVWRTLPEGEICVIEGPTNAFFSVHIFPLMIFLFAILSFWRKDTQK